MLSTFTWIFLIVMLIIIKYVYVILYKDKQLFKSYNVHDETQ